MCTYFSVPGIVFNDSEIFLCQTGLSFTCSCSVVIDIEVKQSHKIYPFYIWNHFVYLTVEITLTGNCDFFKKHLNVCLWIVSCKKKKSELKPCYNFTFLRIIRECIWHIISGIFYYWTHSSLKLVNKSTSSKTRKPFWF